MPVQKTLLPAADNTLETPPIAQLASLSPAWRLALGTGNTRAALHKISDFLDARLAEGAEIYPRHVFRALEYVQPASARVVILGQDPYHGANQAQGLAFSVPDACRCPPSLRNMFKEIAIEYPGTPLRTRHYLGDWAQQGVLLLNTVLTVEAGSPGSHAKQGWEAVTDAIIRRVAESPQPKVFMLWGAHAQSKQALLAECQGGPINVLTANHPSPLSAQRPPKPFIGCGHFAQANAWLHEQGETEIDWLERV